MSCYSRTWARVPGFNLTRVEETRLAEMLDAFAETAAKFGQVRHEMWEEQVANKMAGRPEERAIVEFVCALKAKPCSTS